MPMPPNTLLPPLTDVPDCRVGVAADEMTSPEPPLDGVLNENVLLSFPIAVTLSLLVACAFLKIKAGAPVLRVLFVEIYLALYWLLGAASMLFAAIVVVRWFWRKKHGVLLMLLWLFVSSVLPYVVFGVTFLRQYAPAQIFAGINYYRAPIFSQLCSGAFCFLHFYLA